MHDLTTARPAARTARMAVANRLHSAAIHLLRRVRRTDHATGLSPARLSALSALVFGGPHTVGELAVQEQVTAPTTSRLVQALEDAGLVERRPDPDDGRLVRIAATPEGARVLLRARREQVEHLAERLRGLSPDEVAGLGRAAEIIERLLHEE